MPLNKIHLLKKARKNIEIFSEVIKTFNVLKKEPVTVEENIEFLIKENNIQREQIKSLKNKCDLIEDDMLKLVHSINILNYVLEAAILNSDEITNLKKNIKYH